jgi:hypothetical protein
VLDRFAAQADGGFDLLAAFHHHRLDGIEADLNHRIDSIEAPLDDFLGFLAALFDNRLDGLAASEDRGFYRACHRSPPRSAPAPGADSIIIFIESALGFDATSIA